MRFSLPCFVAIVALLLGSAAAAGELSVSRNGEESTSALLSTTAPAGRAELPPQDDSADGDRPVYILGTNWFFHDTGTGTYGSNKWGQSSTAPDLVESMDQTAPTGTGSNQFLFVGQLPYYAAGASVTTDYHNNWFGAKLWLINPTGASNTVYVKLYKGTWNTDGSITETSLLGSDSVTLSSSTLTEYSFDLGRPASDVSSFTNQSLIVKITASTSGLTKLYWDDSSYKSKLHSTPVLDYPGDCPPIGHWEGEPIPHDEYVDHYNGGCNSDPEVFIYADPSDPGTDQYYCGTSGTFYVQGTPNRDTDWYQIDLTVERDLGFSVLADFPVQIFLIDGNEGCANPTIIEQTSGDYEEQVGVYAHLQPGVYWLWVGPQVFEGVPPGAEYVMSITGNWNDPVPEPAVCCVMGYCYVMDEFECDAVGGDWYPYLFSCDPNPCYAVCCLSDGTCFVTLEDDCYASGGDWYPDYASCDPNPCEAEFPTDWYFDDTGTAGWGQTYTPPYWEWMNAGPLPECIMYDLDVENPYYACSNPLTEDYSGYLFYAELWMDNNYEDHTSPVTLELRRGGWNNQGTLVASATGYCVTYMDGPPTGKYLYNFGVIPDLNLDDESLVIKIIYTGQPGDTHIYWHGDDCPSGLHAVGPGNPGPDTVVCEAQGDGNPTHPKTFWYDVTPGDFGRCDFHVRVFDPIQANYSNVTKPNATWQFAVHQVGSDWWASWWDPDCENAIFDTFRFQFDNTSGATWSDWTTTIGASSNPYLWVIDFTGRHFLQPDGYGGRVHVPNGVHVDYLDHDVGDVRLTMTDQGILGFMDDTQAQGSGFVYPKDTGSNLLYIGGLWVGVEPDYVANRDYNADPAKEWLVTTSPDGRCWETEHGVSHQDIHAAYDDAGAGTPMGIFVDQESYAWGTNTLATDHVTINYTVMNEGTEILSDIYVGCFLDLDLGDYGANTGGVESSLNLVYLTEDDQLHAGVVYLEDAGDPPVSNITLIDNPTFVYPNTYILDADKYGFLSAGGGQYVLTDGSTPNDYGVLAAAGPITLVPGESMEISFAVVGGETFDELLTHAKAAQMIHAMGYSDAEDPTETEMPRLTCLMPMRPNPFTTETTVHFRLAQAGRIQLGVYDVGGRLLKTLVDGQYPAREYNLSWDGRDERGQQVPGGVYFMQLETERHQECRRVIRLR